MVPSEGLKEAAAKAVMEQIGMNLARLQSNESGRILETAIQLLPDEVFQTLSYLVVGNENDDIAKHLVFETVFRIANKLGLEFETPDPVNEAVMHTLILINCENLRRKGHVEYSAPDNIFTDKPKYAGYNKLTESGKQLAIEQMLLMPFREKYVM